MSGGVSVIGDVVTTLSWASFDVRAFKGTRRSSGNAGPKISPGLSPWYPVRGIVCRLEETKHFEGFEPS